MMEMIAKRVEEEEEKKVNDKSSCGHSSRRWVEKLSEWEVKKKWLKWREKSRKRNENKMKIKVYLKLSSRFLLNILW